MSNLNWPDTLDLTLSGIAQGGEGVGRWEGRVVFAGGGLPGERVRVGLRERHEAYARGDVVEVFEPSPDRVPPRQPGADSMPWQHIAYPAQLRFKRQILADQLAKIAGLADIFVEETLPASPPWAYRNSAHFHSDGRRVGYYAAESRVVQEIPADPLLLPVLNEALAGLRESLLLGAPFEAALHGPPGLRDLVMRWRGRCPPLAGVVIQPQGAPPIQIGADHLIEELGRVAFRLRPTTFFQVNLASATALLRLARAGLELRPEERLLDLYCGAGAFALPLAGEAAEVVGIEEHAGAVADARATAAENGIASARFIVGRVEQALRELDQPFDAAILDPPRRGCHPQALESLLRLAPPRLVYVSCQPATLARDLKRLVGGGYRVLRVQPVDLFPQTPHIESVSVLARD
jgi:23S rRNA (uracil1939-C5)-methyltransferase